MWMMNLCQMAWALACAVSVSDALPTEAERSVLYETYNQRSRSGLSPLGFDLRLMRAARSHAANMGNLGVMSHNLQGSTPGGRAAWFGYAGGVRENVAHGYGPENVVGTAWMNSPPHRANILSGTQNIGIGMVWARGRWWACQVFGN
jgi:uncharacterized protein YkwD